jgi:L-amino acid N-acyltransferase
LIDRTPIFDGEACSLVLEFRIQPSVYFCHAPAPAIPPGPNGKSDWNIVMIIRTATTDDMPGIVELYNALIPTTTITWTENLQTLSERIAWFGRQHEAGHVTLVAEENGQLIGFCAYGHFRGAGNWYGYRHTVEHTIHVAKPWWGKGVGRQLVENLIECAVNNGIHTMVAGIDADNVESIQFHERLGFTVTARMPEVGTKFGRWLDLVLMQRILTNQQP